MSQKVLKIAMLGHKRVPSREGGVEVVVEELSTRMVTKGYDVTCFNRKKSFDVKKIFKGKIRKKTYRGVKIVDVCTIDIKGLAALTSSFFATIKASLGDYDVVHFHAEGPCAWMWIATLFQKRCVATIHGLDWKREKWKGGFASKYIKFGEKIAVKHADSIIVLSENAQDYFATTYNRKTIYIPNGIAKNASVEAKEIFEKFGLEKDSYILYLARLVPEKGLKYLIQAFKQVDTDRRLVIAGEASDTESFVKEMFELAKTDDRIRFVGFVSGRVLEELYSNAYFYTLPSDLEGMPLTLLEAMSYDNCCLISDIKEMTEVVGENAYAFEQGNIKDLKEKLQMLCDSQKKVSDCKCRIREHVSTSYDWNRVVDKTLECYTGTTKEKSNDYK